MFFARALDKLGQFSQIPACGIDGEVNFAAAPSVVAALPSGFDMSDSAFDMGSEPLSVLKPSAVMVAMFLFSSRRDAEFLNRLEAATQGFSFTLPIASVGVDLVRESSGHLFPVLYRRGE